MMVFRPIVWIFLSICLVLPYSALAGIAVEPALVLLDFDSGRAAGRFVITNTGEETKRYRVVASHFDLSEEGGLSLAAPNEYSMVDWIKFNPKEFTLPPNSKRVVRYVVLPRGKVADGQYWAAMELESLEGRDYSTSDDEGRTFNLKVVPSVLAPMYGSAGTLAKDFEVLNIDITTSDRDIPVVTFRVKNTGNGVINFRGNYVLTDTEDKEVAKDNLAGGILLRDKSRTFVSQIKPDIPNGKYNMKLVYESASVEKKYEFETEVEIKAN